MCVLVPVALDADVLIYDRDFDVAVALLLFGDNGVGLVFADIEEVMEALFAGHGEGGVHFLGDHFVGSTLHWEKLALSRAK